MLQQVPLFWLYSSIISQEGRTSCESHPSLVSLHILKIGANMQECQRKLFSFLQRPVQGVLNVLVCHFANALLAVTSLVIYFFLLTLWICSRSIDWKGKWNGVVAGRFFCYGNELGFSCRYVSVSGFHGVLAGFLVAVKQIMPDQEVSVLFKLHAKVSIQNVTRGCFCESECSDYASLIVWSFVRTSFKA